MYVVATAGHVDHGKSTLIRALTGSDPDRLSEERRRGLSIELGYCWTKLDGAGDVAFVDVPGHQRYISTALAGLGGAPAVLFVVAADDPWMPQAAEHLAALDALGVKDGVLAVTRGDLADPAPAISAARAALARTGLRDVPHVVVSGRTGAGMRELRQRLSEVLGKLPVPDPTEDVRLWVDRRFHLPGKGTVLTGTLQSGTVSARDSLCADAIHRVRVRGLQSLERPRQSISAPARVALSVGGGRLPQSVDRGSTLTTPGAFVHSSLVDVQVSGEESLPSEPILHVGSAALTVHARPLGQEYWRLRLTRPLPLRVGDRVALRDPGRRAIWSVRILDPMPPPLLRRGAASLRARRLTELDGSHEADLRVRGFVRVQDVARMGFSTTQAPAGSVTGGNWLVASGYAQELRGQLLTMARDAANNLQELHTNQAARQLDLPDVAIVEALVQEPLSCVQSRIFERSAILHSLEPAVSRLETHLAHSPFDALTAAQLGGLGLDRRACALLAQRGRILDLGGSVILLPGADDQALHILRTVEQPFTVSQARRALGSSRRVVLALLAHLERNQRVARLTDDRRRVCEQ